MWKFDPSKGQTILEYLMVTTLVSCLVFYALLGKNHMMLDLHNEVNVYFDTAGKAVAGGYAIIPSNLTFPNNQGTLTVHNPAPIAGGWCPWGSCIEQYRERECACPRPNYGGSYCSGSPIASCAGAGIMDGSPSCIPTDCASNGWDCGYSVVCPAVSCGTCPSGPQWACVSHECTCTPNSAVYCQDNGCGEIVACPSGYHCNSSYTACEANTCAYTPSCIPLGGVGNPCGIINECGEACSCATGLTCSSSTTTCCNDAYSTCTAPAINCNTSWDDDASAYVTDGLTGCNNPCTRTQPASYCNCGDGFCASGSNAYSPEDCWSCPEDCGYSACDCTIGTTTTVTTTTTTGCAGATLRVVCEDDGSGVTGNPKVCMGTQTNCTASPSFGGNSCLPCDGGGDWTARITNPETGDPAVVTCIGGVECFNNCPSCGGVCQASATCWGDGNCCVPNCPANKCSGPDLAGCGTTCSATCPGVQVCYNQYCCAPNCPANKCSGPDLTPCGTTCSATCTGIDVCYNEYCCTPNCTLKCGGASDNCGGSCTAACGTGYNCVAQACVLKQCYLCTTHSCTATTTCAFTTSTFYSGTDQTSASFACSGTVPTCGGQAGNSYRTCVFGSYGASCP